MLKRIHLIKNIGNFVDCKSSAGCQFRPLTIIFAKNTRGKSTLTAILRSIKSGNPDGIIGRKTFGSTGNQRIDIEFDGPSQSEKYIFENNKWNKTNPNIIVFDTKFITDNIFEGENINFEHQKNLNTIIIGEEGKLLSEEIKGLQIVSDAFEAKKRDLTQNFAKAFPNSDLAKFRKLVKDAQIDDKIADKQQELKFEQDKESIRQIVIQHIRNLKSINFKVKPSLQKNLSTKQQEIEEHIKKHLITGTNAEAFLKEGLSFLKPKTADKRNCVFCGQEMLENAEALMTAYSNYFSGGYQSLQLEINSAIKYLKSLNIEALLQRCLSDLSAKGLSISLDSNQISNLVTLKQLFEIELDKKLDLNYSIDFTSFDEIERLIGGLIGELELLEKNKLSSTSRVSIVDLKAELGLLEIVKKRFEPVWVQLCEELDKVDSDAAQLRKERDNKRAALDKYSRDIFDLHRATINTLLKDMGADFEIEDFKPIKRISGKSERIFAIKFFKQHLVQIDAVDDKVPNFKNTLSDSDKRLLAFAFFVSMLKHDKDLNKKIVVFDDPMSSYDEDRRRDTANIIADLKSTYKDAHGTDVIIQPVQKIVLTHEVEFARRLASEPNVEVFKIALDKSGPPKQSVIMHLDLDMEFPTDATLQRIKQLQLILDNNDFGKAIETDCRLVLEDLFKLKYYEALKDNIKARKGVRTFVNTLNGSCIGGFDDVAKYTLFGRLCDDLNIEMHNGSSTLSNGDKRSILTDFFKCLKAI